MIRLGPLERLDAYAAATGHLEAFPGFFLSSLGRRGLRAFYQAVSVERSTFTVGAWDGAHLVGVAVGTTQPTGWYTRLIRAAPLAFIGAGLSLSITRPRVIAHLLPRLRGGLAGDDQQRGVLLASIYVASAARTRGAGTLLLTRWCDTARATGADQAWLTTDVADNERVVQFYERNGWHRASVVRPRADRSMLVLCRPL